MEGRMPRRGDEEEGTALSLTHQKGEEREEWPRVKNVGRSCSSQESGVRQESSTDSGDEKMLKEEGGGCGVDDVTDEEPVLQGESGDSPGASPGTMQLHQRHARRTVSSAGEEEDAATGQQPAGSPAAVRAPHAQKDEAEERNRSHCTSRGPRHRKQKSNTKKPLHK
ncbi:hypothetical protein Q8A73_002766 [Channa argus]|nr:hypothetical protein Q8A73_002766 [Channa argus]